MIHFLNETLRQLFLSRIHDLQDPSQVSFEFPEEEFRSQVKTHGRNTLNISLVDLRENRTTLPAGPAGTSRRIDCHYLISAWSPAARNVEPAFDEHALLYQAMAVLMETELLVPGKVYGRLPLPKSFPEILRDAELPLAVQPVERFARMAEFWLATRGTLWKPSIHLVATLPVVSQDHSANL